MSGDLTKRFTSDEENHRRNNVRNWKSCSDFSRRDFDERYHPSCDFDLNLAFNTILVHKVSAVAVTNSTGEIISNLSASDLKGITESTFFKLEAPIHQILLLNQKKVQFYYC